jgi:peptide/nickel transport system ATP-binding protein
MYGGRIVEMGFTSEVYRRPRHPYTEALLAATPDIARRRPGPTLVGVPPRLDVEQSGCPFAPRCPKVMDACHEERPPFVQVGQGHYAACLLNNLPVSSARSERA